MRLWVRRQPSTGAGTHHLRRAVRGGMAKTHERQDAKERDEALVKVAESQGLPRPVAERIVDEVMAKGVAPEKLKEAVEETARIEVEDRKLATGQTT